MVRKGPLLTLLTGGGLMAGLLIANVVVAADPEDDGDLIGAGADATPTVAPSPGVSGSPPPPGQSPPPPEQSPGASPGAGDQAGEPTTYVGRVDAGGVAVAIVIEPEGDEATAYVCDGVNEVWLRGPAEAGELALDGDGAELTAAYDDQQATGETTLAGQDLTFTIDLVEQPEGLFRVADTIIGGAEVDGGWIQLPDGTQIGVLNVDGESASAPELNPKTGEVTVDGTTIVADRVG